MGIICVSWNQLQFLEKKHFKSHVRYDKVPYLLVGTGTYPLLTIGQLKLVSSNLQVDAIYYIEKISRHYIDWYRYLKSFVENFSYF